MPSHRLSCRAEPLVSRLSSNNRRNRSYRMNVLPLSGQPKNFLPLLPENQLRKHTQTRSQIPPWQGTWLRICRHHHFP
jgi:hypothetical protein